MAQGIGYKDTDGSYGFRLTEDGKVILGNSSDDVIQVTGTLSVSGTFYAGTESPEQYHQVIGRFLVDAAGTNNSELIIDGPNPNFIMLQRAGTLTGKMATDGYRFTMYGGSNMVSQAYTDSGVGKIDFCNSNTQVTSGTKHKVNITASSDALRIDTDSGTNVFRVSGADTTIAGDMYVDVIRRQSDSSTTTKIRLQDEVVRIHAGNANDEVLKIETGTVTVAGELDATTLDISGDADIDGTLETDALSINGTTITATGTELNYVDGVTSAIQTQLDAKAPSTGIAASALASDCIVPAKIDTSVAGDGITGGGGSALAVGAGTGVTVNANDVAIGQAVGTGDTVEFSKVKLNTSTIGGNEVVRVLGTGDNFNTLVVFGADTTTEYVSLGVNSDGNPTITGGYSNSTQPSNLCFATQEGGGAHEAVKMTLTNDGKLGINKTDPTVALAIGGDLDLSDSSTIKRVTLEAGTGADAFFGFGEDSNERGWIGWDAGDQKITLGSVSDNGTFNDTLVVNDAKVGIGTSTPYANLSIEGDADGGVVSIRLGADNSSASNFSGRLEFAEDTDGSQVMTYGAFMDYDGDAGSGFGNGMLNIGMRSNSTTDTNVLRIDRDAPANSLHINDQSVAIGTTDHISSEKLTLVNTTTGENTGFLYAGGTSDGSPYFSIAHVNSSLTRLMAGSIGTGDNALAFSTSDSSEDERMRITADGKVGINDTTPSYTLDVNGDIRCTDDLFVDDFARIDALRVGTTSTDPGDGNLYIEGDITLAGGDIKDSGGHSRISFTNSGTLTISDYAGNAEALFADGLTTFQSLVQMSGDHRVAGSFSVGSRSIFGDALANVDGSKALIQVKQFNDDENGGGLTIEQSATSDEWTIWHSSAENLNFSFNGSSKGYLNDSTNVSNITFTGQHRCSPSDSSSFTELSSSVGKIVVSDGTYSNLQQPGVSINESIPKVTLSTSRNQKSAFGVVSDAEDENSDTREYSNGTFVTVAEKSDSSDNRLYINSLGEGGIWISNINGNIENGDYITTCEIPGYGMKQDDDLLHNYTVAKITQDCLFDLNSTTYECEEIQHNGQTYRAAFVGCTYHCG